MAAALCGGPTPERFKISYITASEKKGVDECLVGWFRVISDRIKTSTEPEKFRDALSVLSSMHVQLSIPWHSTDESYPGTKIFLVRDTAKKIQAMAAVRFFRPASSARKPAVVLELLLSNPINYPHRLYPSSPQVRGAGCAAIKHLKSFGRDVLVDPLDSARAFYTRRGFKASDLPSEYLVCPSPVEDEPKAASKAADATIATDDKKCA